MANGLWISPDTLDFGQLAQGNSSTLQVVVGNTSNDTALNWNVDNSGTSWLTVDVSSGTLQPGIQQAINVTANTTSLAAGNYTAALNFTSDGENIEVSVVLVVQAATPVPSPIPTPPVPPPPLIGLSSGLLNFGTTQVRSVQTQQVTVTNNSGNAQLSWSADTGGASWVTLDVGSGTLQPGNQQTVNVTVDTSTLSADVNVGSNYEAALTFTANDGQNVESENVYVQVNVRPAGQPVFVHIGGPNAPVASPTSLNFGTLPGRSATLQVVISNISTDTALPWVADTGGATWLSLDITSGTLAHRPLASSNQTINVTANGRSLAPGRKNSATLTFTSTDPTLAPPKSVQVSVTMNT